MKITSPNIGILLAFRKPTYGPSTFQLSKSDQFPLCAWIRIVFPSTGVQNMYNCLGLIHRYHDQNKPLVNLPIHQKGYWQSFPPYPIVQLVQLFGVEHVPRREQTLVSWDLNELHIGVWHSLSTQPRGHWHEFGATQTPLPEQTVLSFEAIVKQMGYWQDGPDPAWHTHTFGRLHVQCPLHIFVAFVTPKHKKFRRSQHCIYTHLGQGISHSHYTW
jgi:hypothetical protein